MIPLLLAACASGQLDLGEDPTPADSPAAFDGRRCALTSDLDDPFLLEGEAVAFTVGCAGDLPVDEAELRLVSAPPGLSWDPATRRAAWQTGLADAGRWDVVFEVRPRGADDLPEGGAVTLHVADDWSHPDNAPVDPATYTEEWGLPVMHVLPRGGLSQDYVPAELHFQGQRLAAEIKVRGAASAGYPKNSFTLDFDEEELRIDAWGRSRDHLVLLTTFDDNSYVRQKLVYDQWAAMAETAPRPRLTPRTFFMVLYLDGEYHGLYVGLDHINDEFMRHMGLVGEGNLYKAVSHDANFSLTGANGAPKSDLAAGYEKKEGLPEADTTDLRELVAFTGGATDAALLAEAEGWLDLDEFVDWQLLVGFSAAGDSAGKNCYLYNDLDGAGFRYVPWDFNHAWGQSWTTSRVPATDGDTYSGRNRVFLALEREAPERGEQRLAELSAPGGPLDPEWLLDTLDAYYGLIEPSARRDWARWEDEYRRYSLWSGSRNAADDWQDFDGERAYLEAWIVDRAEVFAER